MENRLSNPESESLQTGVFELPGEPAVIINGVPDVPPSDGTPILADGASAVESHESTGAGEWLEGREVWKFFLDRYYSGTVTKFDKETGWYRVEYEDGDSEDLDWRELEEVLLPLDVTIPLKALALKIVKKTQKSSHKSGQNAGWSQTRKTTNSGKRAKKIEGHEEGS